MKRLIATTILVLAVLAEVEPVCGQTRLPAEHRSFEKLAATQSWFLAAAGGYRFLPWLVADIGYEYWQIGGNPFHKAVTAVTGTLRSGNLSTSLRERYEFCFNNPNHSTLRTRLKVQYSFEKSIFQPYLMAEIFNWSSWMRSLNYVGTEITVNRHNSFDIFYMCHLQAEGPVIHTFGAGYYLNF